MSPNMHVQEELLAAESGIESQAEVRPAARKVTATRLVGALVVFSVLAAIGAAFAFRGGRPGGIKTDALVTETLYTRAEFREAYYSFTHGKSSTDIDTINLMIRSGPQPTDPQELALYTWYQNVPLTDKANAQQAMRIALLRSKAGTTSKPPSAAYLDFSQRYSFLTAGKTTQEVMTIDLHIRSLKPVAKYINPEVKALHDWYMAASTEDQKRFDIAAKNMLNSLGVR